MLGGLQASAAVISHTGYQEGVAINVTPLGSRALFGMPARGAVEHLDRVRRCRRTVGRELWERLQGLTTWADRFAACDAVLARIVDRDRMVVPELRGVWHTLVRTGGTDPISNLAATVGWSRQHLARRFRDEFGFGPKLAARVVRFERARHMLQATPSFVTIAQVAAACGYYDQAHLDRDFAELAGCTPTAWLAEELPTSKTTPPPPCDRRAMATTTRHPTVWPVLSYRDARGFDFLAKAFGFEGAPPTRAEDDPSIIEHAEMRWPLGGGVMFGSAGKDDSPFGRRTPGNDSVYVVCDDPDASLRARGGGWRRRGARSGRRGLRVARVHRPGPWRATCGASAPTPASDPRLTALRGLVGAGRRVGVLDPHRAGRGCERRWLPVLPFERQHRPRLGDDRSPSCWRPLGGGDRDHRSRPQHTSMSSMGGPSV